MQIFATENLPSVSSGSPRIMSLNIRSILKGVDKIKDNIDIFQEKCDIICFCETNAKVEKDDELETDDKRKANVKLDDISLDGFHPPIYKNPYRDSGKGGGLAVYVNKRFCDCSDITCIKLDDPKSMENKSESNPPGEFLFVKIAFRVYETNVNKKSLIKNIIVGNVYRSPSSNHTKFIERLEGQL